MTRVFNRIMRAGGRKVALKAAKAMPILGVIAVAAFAGYEIRKKGIFRGIANVALDATPLLGSAKNVIEVFTGDWLPDKDERGITTETQRARRIDGEETKA